MYCYIVCPECGYCLAHVYDLYLAMKKDRVEEYLQDQFDDIDPRYLNIYGMDGFKLGDILDDLNVRLQCCRTHMMAQVEIRELLY